MVSGFHGNTDPVMVMFLVLAASMCLKNKPALSGLFLALSCQIKIVPLLFRSDFLFLLVSRRAIVSFLLPLTFASVALWWEPLLKFPALFAKNVLSYSGFWGIWGITYWLRLTGLPEFSVVNFFHLPLLERIVITILKLVIIAAVLMIAWRRRKLSGERLFDSLAYAWIIFFVFAPSVSAQYLIWLAPFCACAFSCILWLACGEQLAISILLLQREPPADFRGMAQLPRPISTRLDAVVRSGPWATLLWE